MFKVELCQRFGSCGHCHSREQTSKAALGAVQRPGLRSSLAIYLRTLREKLRVLYLNPVEV